MTIEVLPQAFSVCKVETLSPELLAGEFCFCGRTDSELSLVCRTEAVPARTLAREDGWRGLRVCGQLDFSLVGILAELSRVLAEQGISIFALSTYDTDYILVRADRIQDTVSALRRAGFQVIMAHSAT